MFIYLLFAEKLQVFILPDMGFPYMKKYFLWFIQSSNNYMGTRVPEHFWDFLWKISNSVGEICNNKTIFLSYGALSFNIAHVIYIKWDEKLLLNKKHFLRQNKEV